MKKYSKKQITEAISYWKKQLKKMNESEYEFDPDEQDAQDRGTGSGGYDGMTYIFARVEDDEPYVAEFDNENAVKNEAIKIVPDDMIDSFNDGELVEDSNGNSYVWFSYDGVNKNIENAIEQFRNIGDINKLLDVVQENA